MNIEREQNSCCVVRGRKPGQAGVCQRADKKRNGPVSLQRGLTYVEILIAMTILVVGLVPALDALRSATTGSELGEGFVVDQYRMSGRLEEVLAEPFGDLDAAALVAGSPTTPTTYSEAPGTPGRVLIYLARYDGDDADSDSNPFTGGDEGLLWVRAEIENTPQANETLVSQ